MYLTQKAKDARAHVLEGVRQVASRTVAQISAADQDVLFRLLGRMVENLRQEPSTYAQHLRLFTHELGLDQATKEAILGKTGMALWHSGHAKS